MCVWVLRPGALSIASKWMLWHTFMPTTSNDARWYERTCTNMQSSARIHDSILDRSSSGSSRYSASSGDHNPSILPRMRNAQQPRALSLPPQRRPLCNWNRVKGEKWAVRYGMPVCVCAVWATCTSCIIICVLPCPDLAVCGGVVLAYAVKSIIPNCMCTCVCVFVCVWYVAL